jgi:hypothetical protein
MSFICGVWHTPVTVSVTVFVGVAVRGVGLAAVWGCLVEGLGIDSNPVGTLGITKGDPRPLNLWKKGIPGFPEAGMSPVD